MISIISKTIMSQPKEPNKYLHWVVPMAVGVGITAIGFLFSVGAYPQRITDLERRTSALEQTLKDINSKLDTLATKDDVREFKRDVQRQEDMRTDRKR